MAGRYPKPDGEHHGHSPTSRGHRWVELPREGRSGPVPELPAWRVWHPETLAWWVELWAMPQATQWAQDGTSLRVAACLMDDLIAGRAEAAKVSAEWRQHADRHGLSGPKSMLQLGWRFAPADAPPAPPPAKAKRSKVASLDDRRTRVSATLGDSP